jgi:2-methylcitrate dehydratase PrpD
MVGPDLEDLRARGFKAEHGQTLCFETATLGQPFAILAHGLKVKRYPTCASTHRALDAALDLRARHVLSAETVARIDVFAPVTHFNNLMYTDPKSAAEAKFSMEYCLAVALKQGAIGLADFTASALADRALRREMAKVARHPVDQPESRFPTRVDIVLTSGKILSATVDAPKGRADNPLTDDELWEKLRQCCRDAVDPEHAKRIERALRAFDDAPVTALMSELRSEAAR